MKKIKIMSLIIFIIISLSTNVLAISTTHIATRTAIMTTMMSTAARRHGSSYTINKAVEYIFNETQNEDLKNYILENKKYLYLNSEDRAKEIINKYKESNLEETKQFIKDNYYDENKPETEKRIVTILAVTLVIFLIIIVGFGIYVIII